MSIIVIQAQILSTWPGERAPQNALEAMAERVADGVGGSILKQCYTYTHLEVIQYELILCPGSCLQHR